jgi:hypothetical protein
MSVSSVRPCERDDEAPFEISGHIVERLVSLTGTVRGDDGGVRESRKRKKTSPWIGPNL